MKSVTVNLPDHLYDKCEWAAGERDKAYAASSNTAILGPYHNLKGVLGEAAFGWLIFREPDHWTSYNGDGGIDFRCIVRGKDDAPRRVTIDVKTAAYPKYLPGRGKQKADAYVMCGTHHDNWPDEKPSSRVSVIGWEWGRILWQAEMRDLSDGVLVHCILAADLRPMDEMLDRIIDEQQRHRRR